MVLRLEYMFIISNADIFQALALFRARLSRFLNLLTA